MPYNAEKVRESFDEIHSLANGSQPNARCDQVVTDLDVVVCGVINVIQHGQLHPTLQCELSQGELVAVFRNKHTMAAQPVALCGQLVDNRSSCELRDSGENGLISASVPAARWGWWANSPGYFSTRMQVVCKSGQQGPCDVNVELLCLGGENIHSGINRRRTKPVIREDDEGATKLSILVRTP